MRSNHNTYALSQEESQRIDIMKFIAMILVVYIHAQNVGNPGNDIQESLPLWVYTFENIISKDIAGMADSLFFLLSAILLFRSEKKYGEMLRSKCRTLVLPYLLWNTLWVVIFFCFEKISFTSVYFTNPEYRVSTWGVLEFFKYYGISLTGYPLLYPLWFMRDIMIMMLISPLIHYVVKRIPKISLTISLIMMFIPISFPYKGAFLLFIMGACIVEMEWHMELVDRIPGYVALAIYAALIIGKEMIGGIILAALLNLWGMVFFIKLSKIVYNSKSYGNTFVKEVIGYSFAIYVGHEMFLTILKKLSAAVLPQTWTCVMLEYLLYPILLIGLCVSAAMIIRSKFPKLYNTFTGSRG